MSLPGRVAFAADDISDAECEKELKFKPSLWVCDKEEKVGVVENGDIERLEACRCAEPSRRSPCNEDAEAEVGIGAVEEV